MDDRLNDMLDYLVVVAYVIALAVVAYEHRPQDEHVVDAVPSTKHPILQSIDIVWDEEETLIVDVTITLPGGWQPQGQDQSARGHIEHRAGAPVPQHADTDGMTRAGRAKLSVCSPIDNPFCP